MSVRSDVEPFYVMEVLAAAAQRQRTHGDVISLCAGQPSTPAPAQARAEATRAIESESLGYTEALGILPLREAIAAYYRQRYGSYGLGDVTAEDVVVTTGSSGAFTLLFLAALDEGDTVVMTRPGYPAYRNTLRALGVNVVEVDARAEQGYQLSVTMLEAFLRDRGHAPRAVIVASPANPTGTIISADALGDIARWCQRHGSLLVSDEIYHGIEFAGRAASAWEFSRDAVVIGSVSKYFSMTGWRVGWMLVPPSLRRRIEILASNLTICPPHVSQRAALGALAPEASAELDAYVRTYAANRDLVVRRLPELGITRYASPDGAFYAWCDVSHLTQDSITWCQAALEATGVAVTPGVDFDTALGQEFIRISLAVSTGELDEALDRLAAWVNAERG